MARVPNLSTLFLTAAVATTFAAASYLMPNAALAKSSQPSNSTPKTTCNERIPIDLPGIHLDRPLMITPRDTLGDSDELAALEVIQTALSDVADGATFVWHHRHGRLSAIINPTASFRNAQGRICRHVHLLLNSGDFSRKSEGVACRSTNGIWSLDG